MLAAACSAPEPAHADVLPPTSRPHRTAPSGTAAATPVPISTVAAGPQRRDQVQQPGRHPGAHRHLRPAPGAADAPARCPCRKSFSAGGRSTPWTARRAGSITLSNAVASATRSRIPMRLMPAPYPRSRRRRPPGRRRPPIVINDTGNCRGDRACSRVTRVGAKRSLDPARPVTSRGTPVTCPSLLRCRPPPPSSSATWRTRGTCGAGVRRFAGAAPAGRRSGPVRPVRARRRRLDRRSTASSTSRSAAWATCPPTWPRPSPRSILANELHRRLTFRAEDRVNWLSAQVEAGGVAARGPARHQRRPRLAELLRGLRTRRAADHPRRRGHRQRSVSCASSPCAGSSGRPEPPPPGSPLDSLVGVSEPSEAGTPGSDPTAPAPSPWPRRARVAGRWALRVVGRPRPAP